MQVTYLDPKTKNKIKLASMIRPDQSKYFVKDDFVKPDHIKKEDVDEKARVKTSLGTTRGRFANLSGRKEDGITFVGEGVETSLSVMGGLVA